MVKEVENTRTAEEIAKRALELIISGKVRNHKLGNSSRIHAGEAEREEYRVFRKFLPTRNACLVYDLTGSDKYE
jgi:hypothetical protein